MPRGRRVGAGQTAGLDVRHVLAVSQTIDVQ